MAMVNGREREKIETIRAALQAVEAVHDTLNNFDLGYVKDSVTRELLADIAETCGMMVDRGPGGEAVGTLAVYDPRRPGPRTNAQWAAHQIEKHGRDRYPTAEAQFIKLVEEVGELGKEINRSNPGYPKLGKELADVALALYQLAPKLGFDLDRAINSKAQMDNRRFV